MTPKFLATRNAEEAPNVVPVISILPADDQPDTLFFGNFLLRKNIKNPEQHPRQMSSSFLPYNAYAGIRNAGIIRAKSVERIFRISKLQVAKDYLPVPLAALDGAATSDGT